MAQLDDRAIRKEQTYGQLAFEHAKMKGRGGKNQPPLPTIKPETAEWSAWQRYFIEHLGFEPIAMKRIAWGMSKEMTVPDQWPEQFDASYQTAKHPE